MQADTCRRRQTVTYGNDIKENKNSEKIEIFKINQSYLFGGVYTLVYFL